MNFCFKGKKHSIYAEKRIDCVQCCLIVLQSVLCGRNNVPLFLEKIVEYVFSCGVFMNLMIIYACQ